MLGRFIMEDQIRGKGSNPLVNIIRGGSNMLAILIRGIESASRFDPPGSKTARINFSVTSTPRTGAAAAAGVTVNLGWTILQTRPDQTKIQTSLYACA